MKAFLKTALSTFVLATVSAKEVYEVKEDLNLQTPIVRAYACSGCLFNDGDNYWCIDSDASLNLGWEWK